MSDSHDFIPPTLAEQKENYLDIPFGGLFGNSVIAKVIEEIVADPHSTYSPQDLADLIEASEPRTRHALNVLLNIGFLRSVIDKKSFFKVNMDCKRFVALTMLSYAVLDDIENSSCMDQAIQHYCNDFIGNTVNIYSSYTGNTQFVNYTDSTSMKMIMNLEGVGKSCQKITV